MSGRSALSKESELERGVAWGKGERCEEPGQRNKMVVWDAYEVATDSYTFTSGTRPAATLRLLFFLFLFLLSFFFLPSATSSSSSQHRHNRISKEVHHASQVALSLLYPYLSRGAGSRILSCLLFGRSLLLRFAGKIKLQTDSITTWFVKINKVKFRCKAVAYVQ